MVAAVIEGRDVLMVLPTGYGKSACYQVPSMLLPKPTLVVSPLLALLKDQYDRMIEFGVPCVRLDGSVRGKKRREALERMKAEQVSALDVDRKFGTVGAVALDQNGNLAAGTSTGGMTGKRWGRIGDAPVIGAGTYADNRSCAVSATGWGEYFIRVGVAQEICTRLRLSSETSLEDLAEENEAGGDVQLTDALVQRVSDAVLDEVADLGGDGGVIVVAPSGAAIYSFNTSGMYRGRATSEGVSEVALFGED